MARGAIPGSITPSGAEIVQGRTASTQRPEAGRVEAIVGIMSPPAAEAATDEERGVREGRRQAMDALGSCNNIYPMGGPNGDKAAQDWQKGYDAGREQINTLFGKK